jgi:hypothetical protein
MPGGLEALMAQNTQVRWAVRNGRWTYGVPGFDELVKATEPYTMEGIADRITCPMAARGRDRPLRASRGGRG